MGRVHFIGGEKGGVGKSLVARVLAQYFIDHERPFSGFDLDQSHATFSRFYQDFTVPISVDDFSSLDQILEFAEQHPDQDFILDLAAQTARWLDKWIEDSDVFDIFSELGYQPFYWHVMDDGADSLYLLDKAIEGYHHPDLSFVVVQNLGRGEDFDIFRDTETYDKLAQRAGKVIQLNKLETRLAQKIDFYNSSFWAAANNRDIMSLVERRRVGIWLRSSYTQFDAIFQQPACILQSLSG